MHSRSPQIHCAGRPSAVAAMAALAVIASLLVGPAHADPAPPEEGSAVAQSSDVARHQEAPPEVTDHGAALESINVSMTSEVHTLDDGTDIAYVFNSGQPISVSVLDMTTLEVIDRHEIPGYTVSASHVIDDEDDMLYFSVRSPNDGSLFRYDPYERKVTKLATGVAGEDFLRSMILRDGVIYGSTYPHAKVFSYDVKTGKIRDYGTVEEDSAYAWGFEEVEGDLWVGTGTTPRLREVDPGTGKISDIALPAYMTGEGKDFIHDIVRHGDLVFIRSSPSGRQNLAVYDLKADDWCCENVKTMGTWTQQNHDGKFYYLVGSDVRGYDLKTRKDFSIGWKESELAGEQAGSQLQLVELDRKGYPGTTLMGFRDDGVLWLYNLEERTGELIELPIEGAPATVQSLGIGPDGDPYVGGYLSTGVMSRIDHSNGRIETLDGPGQGDAVTAVDDDLVIGTYSGAGFYAGDMTQEWEWETNPGHLFTIGRENGQDRVSDLIDAGGLAAAGTIPNYGERGGALVLFDPAGGAPQVHRHVVKDHSVVSLAYRDGLIYGGTSIHGGIDSTPAKGPAELFIWDVKAQKRIDSMVIDKSADIIHTLTFDDEGRLWAMTDSGRMIEFDTRTRKVRTTVTTGLGNSNIWGRTSEMAPNPVDGLIYGNAGTRIFTFDPDCREFTVLESEGVRYSAVHEDGTFYFTDRTNVYSFTPDGAAAACDDASPAPRPPFTDVRFGVEHYEAMAWMKDTGISAGWSDGTYRPAQPVNRDAMAAFLYRLAGEPKVNLPKSSPFTDVEPGDQHYRAIVWAAEHGITTGWPDGTFRPTRPITRDAMAAFVYRYAGRPAYVPPTTSPFTDMPTTRMYYREVTWMRERGITTGWSDRTYRPFQATTRDATAAFLFRMAHDGKITWAP
jgi:hypothetical protein